MSDPGLTVSLAAPTIDRELGLFCGLGDWHCDKLDPLSRWRIFLDLNLESVEAQHVFVFDGQ
jgi:hypothetical protein